MQADRIRYGSLLMIFLCLLCRQLLYLYQDILSAPVIGTLNQISAVMAVSNHSANKYMQLYVMYASLKKSVVFF